MPCSIFCIAFVRSCSSLIDISKTSNCTLRALKGVLSSWAESEIKLLSRLSICSVCLSKAFIALINGKISFGSLAAPIGDKSPSLRSCTSLANFAKGESSYAITKIITIKRRANPIPQGVINSSAMSQAISSRYSSSCPTAITNLLSAEYTQTIRHCSPSTICSTYEPITGV